MSLLLVSKVKVILYALTVMCHSMISFALKSLGKVLGRSIRCVLRFPALNLQQAIVKPFLFFISSLPRQAFLRITLHCYPSQLIFLLSCGFPFSFLQHRKTCQRICQHVQRGGNQKRQWIWAGSFFNPPPRPLAASLLVFADHAQYYPIPKPTKLPATQSIKTADCFCFLLKSEISLLNVVGQLSS